MNPIIRRRKQQHIRTKNLALVTMACFTLGCVGVTAFVSSPSSWTWSSPLVRVGASTADTTMTRRATIRMVPSNLISTTRCVVLFSVKQSSSLSSSTTDHDEVDFVAENASPLSSSSSSSSSSGTYQRSRNDLREVGRNNHGRNHSNHASPQMGTPLRMLCDEQREFELNLGKAVDTLKHDYPYILTDQPGMYD